MPEEITYITPAGVIELNRDYAALKAWGWEYPDGSMFGKGLYARNKRKMETDDQAKATDAADFATRILTGLGWTVTGSELFGTTLYLYKKKMLAEGVPSTGVKIVSKLTPAELAKIPGFVPIPPPRVPVVVPPQPKIPVAGRPPAPPPPPPPPVKPAPVVPPAPPTPTPPPEPIKKPLYMSPEWWIEQVPGSRGHFEGRDPDKGIPGYWVWDISPFRPVGIPTQPMPTKPKPPEAPLAPPAAAVPITVGAAVSDAEKIASMERAATINVITEVKQTGTADSYGRLGSMLSDNEKRILDIWGIDALKEHLEVLQKEATAKLLI